MSKQRFSWLAVLSMCHILCVQSWFDDRSLCVVVELPQTSEDDPQKRYSCAWNADESVTVGACV